MLGRAGQATSEMHLREIEAKTQQTVDTQILRSMLPRQADKNVAEAWYC